MSTQESVLLLRSLLGLSDSSRDSEIRSCLESSGGDLELATAMLLSMSDQQQGQSSGNRGHVEPAGPRRVVDDDEASSLALALQLQEEDARMAQRATTTTTTSSTRTTTTSADDDEALARELQAADVASAFSAGPTLAGGGALPLGGGFGGGLAMLLGSKMVIDGILDTVRSEVLPKLVKELEGVELPDLSAADVEGDESSAEGASEKPSISYGIKKLAVTNVQIPPEKVSLKPEPHPTNHGALQFLLEVGDVAASVEGFEWSFKRNTFPKISSSGTGDVHLQQSVVSATLTVGMAGVTVSDCTVKIGSLPVKIKGSLAGPLYSLAIKMFKGTIKQTLEKALSDMALQILQDSASSMLDSMMDDF